MPAIDIKHLLTEWGFNEEVIANFETQDIEIEHLDILTEEDLKLLIPHIGPRRKFQSKLKKYLCELPAEEEQQTYVINTNPKKKLRSEIELNSCDNAVESKLCYKL
ncbi:uncharacterized protein LOC143906193 isoform X1 [Temnothorax americanus]|uniref:uncharacterized protein LOC143906193 isoform X1 n=1 Tax=Temnothorax americanus TaxID=1964332 RepID=UPI0040677251